MRSPTFPDAILDAHPVLSETILRFGEDGGGALPVITGNTELTQDLLLFAYRMMIARHRFRFPSKLKAATRTPRPLHEYSHVGETRRAAIEAFERERRGAARDSEKVPE